MSVTMFPDPFNEPVLDHASGSKERAVLVSALERASADRPDIPAVAGAEEIRGGAPLKVVMPHRHAHVLATGHSAEGATVQKAIDAALRVAPAWAATSL